ncbi:MAG: 4-hydroxy-tetrahydrodipicolinate reductase [Actinobacteria bacterium]|nr:4-hydroxy-tetrahydrodipicolinate reductase [Actinomycetota bacterium]NIS35370.1 4-hydroxy-tetrahydrodipicolinate reductase [Actinomycetota bacterium]NIT98085.1 4-hydroxy-tetrahydrodipicolinate reductase [Actinomycetota bacterium]NIU21720.1 4-hydroxy-tetrahydrodipicolinate reductase [Actinomycetota bacterium]NIU70062.1 4-hydroxy-tetrahydrodipicolinate reductase [Actinomycetota bacterium]
MTRVGVVGADGRMGQEVCRAVEAASDLELVSRVDVDDPIEWVVDAGSEVVVDFTVADAARATLPFLAGQGIHAVVGTTGFDDADLERFRAAFTGSNCLIAPNFAVGAVLMMHFAALAAPYFDTAEVIEFHHDGKVDAPSGTAVRTVERMAAASADWAADPTTHEVVEGSRGGRGPAGIRVHAVRMRGVVANQEVVLGTTGQTLTIRHDTVDRSSFMPGVLLACRSIAEHPGLTLGLEPLLGL